MKKIITCVVCSCVYLFAFAQITCTVDSTCNDTNACTSDFCNNGVCMHHLGALSLTVTGTKPTNCDSCNGSVSLDVNGGTAPYHFSWSTGDTSSSIAGTGAEKCINTGGSQFISASGDTFLADTDFTGGTNFSNAVAIANTTDDAMYQNERFVANGGIFSYNIGVANGDYTVELYFAEIFYGTPGHAGGHR